MDTDERITALEARLDHYERIIGRLVQWASLTPKGRLILKALGL